jgi:hypothetical protein
MAWDAILEAIDVEVITGDCICAGCCSTVTTSTEVRISSLGLH